MSYRTYAIQMAHDIGYKLRIVKDKGQYYSGDMNSNTKIIQIVRNRKETVKYLQTILFHEMSHCISYKEYPYFNCGRYSERDGICAKVAAEAIAIICQQRMWVYLDNPSFTFENTYYDFFDEYELEYYAWKYHYLIENVIWKLKYLHNKNKYLLGRGGYKNIKIK